MAAGSLLALLDDIAAVLDDVALMTKAASQKTAGVLGDDLALNAQQVSGVRAERELPVVWAVAKGSAKNKLIIVPIALALSALLPWLITPLLMIGGAYLCYEGFEKVFHKFFGDKAEQEAERAALDQAFADPTFDMVEFEKEKIEGAIRTDFILSAEIIVIALGTVKDASLLVQIITVCVVAVIMTVGVYTLVAAIVKMDDAGLALLKDQAKTAWSQIKRLVGAGLLWFAPRLMKALTVIGTIAMFMVGGGILVHGIPQSHDILHHAEQTLTPLPLVGDVLAFLTGPIANTLAGVIAGGIVLAVVALAVKGKSVLQ